MGRWDNLCPGCFVAEKPGSICSRCGFDEREKPGPLALKPRTLLNNQYVVGRILGKIGGFGITYLGWDTRLETRVAIKEYLPRDLACRDADRSTVVPHSEEDRELFHYGFQQFMEEARVLAKFDHFNIVRVRNFFEENGTAYLVMDYYEGMTLTEYLRSKGGCVPEKLAVEIMMRVLDGLKEVHAGGFLHRDIKPHNIYLAQGGRPILLDFGAARFAVGERTRSLSVLLTPGFAPPEQYHRKGNQGPWTDIYACGATLYQMLTGSPPPEALERASDEDLRFPEKMASSISPGIRRTLNKALAVAPEKRPKTVKDFQEALAAGLLDDMSKPGSEKVVPASITPETVQKELTQDEVRRRKGRLQSTKILVWITICALVLFPILWGYYFDRQIQLKYRAASQQTGGTSTLAQPTAATRQSRSYSAPTMPSASAPKAGENWREPVTGMEFVWVPGGCYQAGCGSWTNDCTFDESVHRECVQAFWIGKTEVTQGQWKKIAGNNPSHFQKGDSFPVEQVSWDDVKAWIAKLNSYSYGKYFFRLPWEAEWEYACRSGGKPEKYAGGGNLDGVAWYKKNSGDSTHQVGEKLPNVLGIYDMSGNVWEWCEDTYSKHQGGAPRVYLGGSWWNDARIVRCSYRNFHGGPAWQPGSIGFRLVMMTP